MLEFKQHVEEKQEIEKIHFAIDLFAEAMKEKATEQTLRGKRGWEYFCDAKYRLKEKLDDYEKAERLGSKAQIRSAILGVALYTFMEWYREMRY